VESYRIIVSNELIQKIASEICISNGHCEQMYTIAGVFDKKALQQLASSDPLICKLLRQLPTLPEHKIMAIYNVLIEEANEHDSRIEIQ